MTEQYSPLPWAIGSPSRGWIKSVCKGFPEKIVAQVIGQDTLAEREANTALIVRSVNLLPEALAALEAAIEYLEDAAIKSPYTTALRGQVNNVLKKAKQP